MAVDIKTLRIGSHILVNGKRERVRGLDEDNGLIIRFPAEYVNANEVEPISITPEILTEIGFKYHEYDNGKLWEWDLPDGTRITAILNLTRKPLRYGEVAYGA